MVRKLARIHCTYDEMGGILGVSARTLERRYQSDRRFREVIDAGRADGRASLRRAMWAGALQCGTAGAPKGATTLAIFIAKQSVNQGGMGWSDKHQHDVNMTADWASLVAAADEVDLADDWEPEERDT